MTVKYNFSLFAVLLLNLNLYSQSNFFSYERVKVNEISTIEKQFNSKVYNTKSDYVFEEKNGKLINYGKPKLYSREENKVLDFISVRYFYLEKDSLVSKISYSWQSPENAKLKDYSKMFDKTVKKIASDLNLSVGEQGKLNKIIDDTVNGIPVEITERKVTWNYKGAKITIIMLWTEKRGAYVHTDIYWE